MWAHKVSRVLRCQPSRGWTVHRGSPLLAPAMAVPPQHRAQMVPGGMGSTLQRVSPYTSLTWEPHTPPSAEPHRPPSAEPRTPPSAEPHRPPSAEPHRPPHPDPDSSWEEERAQTEDLPEFDINVLVNLLRQENGKDLCVIRVPEELKYVDYFVIVGATSTRHLQAMAQYTLKVFKYLKKQGESHVRLEGKDTDDWMCIDFGNIVVHFMLPETRELYELEKLWTLRSHDDQLSDITPEALPTDFMFGLQQSKE